MLWIPELILAAVAVFFARRVQRNALDRQAVGKALAGRGAVVAAAIVTAAITLCIWRSLNDVATVHDEAS